MADNPPTQETPAVPAGDNITPEEREMLAQLEAASKEAPAEPAPAPEPPAERVMASPVDLPAIEASPPPAKPPAEKDLNLRMLMDIPVDIHVEVGHTQASIRDILRLGVGSVVELDRMAGQSADIIVNGKIIGQGDVVVVNETFGVRLTKLVGVEERIQSL